MVSISEFILLKNVFSFVDIFPFMMLYMNAPLKLPCDKSYSRIDYEYDSIFSANILTLSADACVK